MKDWLHRNLLHLTVEEFHSGSLAVSRPVTMLILGKLTIVWYTKEK